MSLAIQYEEIKNSFNTNNYIECIKLLKELEKIDKDNSTLIQYKEKIYNIYKIKLYSGIKKSYHNEENYLRCKNLVNQLLFLNNKDSIGLEYLSKLSNEIDIQEYEEKWRQSQKFTCQEAEEINEKSERMMAEINGGGSSLKRFFLDIKNIIITVLSLFINKK